MKKVWLFYKFWSGDEPAETSDKFEKHLRSNRAVRRANPEQAARMAPAGWGKELGQGSSKANRV